MVGAAAATLRPHILSSLSGNCYNIQNINEVQNGTRKRLKPGKLSPRRPVPDHILKPPYVASKKPPGMASGSEVHDAEGIEYMRASGRLAAQVLQYAGTLVKPGITTDVIDEAVHQMIIDNGAYPSPLGYGGFPKSVCTSVNECICHGIPDSRELEDGDIINIDVTVYLNGYHGDTSATYFCGDVDEKAKNLVQVTKECLDKAISVCAPGVEFNAIGKVIKNINEVQNGTRKRLKPGKLSPRRPVPDHILKPPYVASKKPPGMASGSEVHDAEGIEYMRASGRLAAQVLQYAGTLVKPGITTDVIDEAVHQMIIDNGAYPSPLGYGGFPKSVCTSVNECICHGIPDSRELEDGDIINIDVTVYLNGYHGDTSATYFCGDVDEKAKNLVQVTKECLDKAISVCAPGVEFNAIGKVINAHADKHSYGVVQSFVGHGVGRLFHSDPVILHYRNNERGRMVLNQTFTIEPMLTMGSIHPIIWDDDWTVVTEDGSLSAQFEHTLLITENGAEILTQC